MLHAWLCLLLTAGYCTSFLPPVPHSAFVVSRTMSSFNPLSFTLAYHTLHTYGLSLYGQSLCSCCLLTTWKCVPLLDLLLCTGQNGLPPTPDTLHFGCSYCLHPSHPFFSSWGAVMLEKKKKTKKTNNFPLAFKFFWLLHDMRFSNITLLQPLRSPHKQYTSNVKLLVNLKDMCVLHV